MQHTSIIATLSTTTRWLVTPVAMLSLVLWIFFNCFHTQVSDHSWNFYCIATCLDCWR